MSNLIIVTLFFSEFCLIMAQYANFTNDRSQQEIEKRFNEADDERYQLIF